MSNSIEAAFLRRQQDRLDELRAKRTTRSLSGPATTVQENDDDWTWFRQELDFWKKRVVNETSVVKAISTNQDGDHHDHDDDDRNPSIIRWKVCELQQDLLDLKTQFFLSTEKSDHMFLAWHEEFIACQSLLEETKQILLPKSNKFVFRRYREAKMQRELQQQRQNQNQPDHNSSSGPNKNDHSYNNNDTDTQSLEQEQQQQQLVVSADGTTIQYLEQVWIQIDTDSIHIIPQGQQRQQQQPDNSAMDSYYKTNGIPVVLNHLKNCRIQYNQPCQLSGLHIVDCQNLIVDFMATTSTTTTFSIQSLHITQCHSLILFAANSSKVVVQQMRLHHSTQVTCHCHITAGAILEACRQVTFYNVQDSNRIKDFQWLKPGIPSPNFTIMAITTSASSSPNNNNNNNPLPTKETVPDTLVAWKHSFLPAGQVMGTHSVTEQPQQEIHKPVTEDESEEELEL